MDQSYDIAVPLYCKNYFLDEGGRHKEDVRRSNCDFIESRREVMLKDKIKQNSLGGTIMPRFTPVSFVLFYLLHKMTMVCVIKCS